MLKVMTIIGTRPDIIRLSRVIPKLDKYCSHILVHTGQNYDYSLSDVFFKDLEIRKPDYFMGVAGVTAAETISNVILISDKIFREVKPDALLLLGDTNSSLAAISAKRLKIPIFHMEAGNRCFDFRVPEEINRKIVDHIADINLPYTQIARSHLLKEGFPPDQIIVTGSPMKEVINYYYNQINNSNILNTLNVNPNKFILVSAHREENVDDQHKLELLFNTLTKINEIYNVPIIVSTHPRTKIQLNKSKIKINKNINILDPFGFSDYIKLQMNAKCVMSDSGTISEESSILNFPALNLREMNERPEAFEEGAVMMVGFSEDRILQGLKILEDHNRLNSRSLKIVNDYDVDNVSEKILRILYSYTDFVNRIVWKNTVHKKYISGCLEHVMG